MIDWAKIREEYVLGNTSYRKLAAKYDVSQYRIERMGKKENWTSLRRNHLQENFAVRMDSCCEKNAKASQAIMDVADQILEKISESLRSLSVVDGNTLKHFTAALKELRDIKGIKSEAEIREQEIRLENLRKSTDKSAEPAVIEVVFNAGDEAWNE